MEKDIQTDTEINILQYKEKKNKNRHLDKHTNRHRDKHTNFHRDKRKYKETNILTYILEVHQ